MKFSIFKLLMTPIADQIQHEEIRYKLLQQEVQELTDEITRIEKKMAKTKARIQQLKR